ncbi:sulfite oxidase-like oxidoreductase [Methanobacterium sp. BAmetb5]|uniref:sulfite oxidase-like oxidoreductase n=1 Tax=Methanobacterium sp. BAmetb5 TaxID=2025351 RepID=UPI0025E72CA0|nr:sulfite oxidase-like oxidoreductase [Methanobacterium sp. BAmetb5]
MKKVLKQFFKGDSHTLDNETIQNIRSDKDVIISPDTQREIRIPPGQHVDNSWPVLHAGQVAKIVPEKWELEIGGLVDEEVKLNYQEFMDLPRVQVFSDIHCVTSWSKLNNLWDGVSTSTIKKLVGIRPEAKYVLVHAHKNFTTNLSLEDFFAPDVLLATHHNGKALSSPHGGPVRLVVPRLYFWKSAKWVTGLEFLAEDKRGFWESAGYHNHGDPWMEERYSWQENLE